MDSCLSKRLQCQVECKPPHPESELGFPTLIPTSVTVTLNLPPLYCNKANSRTSVLFPVPFSLI